MTATTTDTYERAVERIMRAVRRGDMTLEQAAEAWRKIRTLQHECDGARVEYEWRRKHASKQNHTQG